MFAPDPYKPPPYRLIASAFETWFRNDSAHAIRQAEDLCIVLADRRFRSALPKLFPGIAGEYPIDFIASWDIPRGQLPAIRDMALPLVRNELALFPGRNVFWIVPHLFETAEALCERGIETGAPAGQTVRLGGFLPTETERKVCLGALLASGNSRIMLDDLGEDIFSFQTAPAEDPETSSRPHRGIEFVRALAEGKSVADAAVTAEFVSASLGDLVRAGAALKGRLFRRVKSATRSSRRPRRRYVRR